MNIKQIFLVLCGIALVTAAVVLIVLDHTDHAALWHLLAQPDPAAAGAEYMLGTTQLTCLGLGGIFAGIGLAVVGATRP
jgi:hypothetical protein